MHINRPGLARKFLLWFGAALAVVLLAGCEFRLTNLTPDTLQENPSQIYTLSVRVAQRATSIIPGSISPHVIVDGQNFPMRKSALADDIYEFEYPLPAGRTDVAYYYLVTYKIEAGGRQLDREAYTDVQRTRIARRNVLSLTATRGPVGSRIAVLGHGFTPQDAVYVDNSAARTVFESENSVSFFVPALEPNRNYRVSINGPAGSNPIGTFRIDPSVLQVSPMALTLRSGERQQLTFTLANPAPSGGIRLEDTTDIRDSVIMPEVMIQAGQLSTTITVEGGLPGRGNIFIKGAGAGELTIPVVVNPR